MAKTPIPPPSVPVVDPKTGIMDMAWYDWMLDIDRLKFSDLRDVDMTTAAPTNGQVPVWNSASSKWKPGAN